ncbi:MAG: DUF1156 domain-containing protein [Burkholderiales bacterium]|nr:DUF1156 domain-containing protein [Burkholderiales bacterium]
MTTFGDLFTPRQLVALTTFSDLVGEAIERVRRDAIAAGLPDDDVPLRDGGTGARAYAEAVGVYLAFAVSKHEPTWVNDLHRGMTDREAIRETFARQAMPMTWDFAEANTFSEQRCWRCSIGLARGLHGNRCASQRRRGHGGAGRRVIAERWHDAKVVSTDPPYYDNIGYADLSDFFYVWLRRSLRGVYPDLFATLAVPKAEELVATPYRHGGKEKAEAFFLDGMTRALARIAEQAHPAFPVTIYYAFKQQDSEGGQRGERGGDAGRILPSANRYLHRLGDLPRRGDPRGLCHQRHLADAHRARSRDDWQGHQRPRLQHRPRLPPAAPPTPRPPRRREFVSALKRELPAALAELQRANIAPVDLAQAAIGPGMAIYTRYAKVLDAEGKPVTVREALALINQVLDETLAEQEGDFDADTRWALAWFEQHGFAEGEYGVAETLSKAKNTSVEGMRQAGIVESRRGRVRLLKPEELPADWDPQQDARFTHWEAVHQLVRRLQTGGEAAAAELAAKLGSRADTARELAYRLYTVCERKKRAAEALSYNALVQSWPEIARLAQERPAPAVTGELFS